MVIDRPMRVTFESLGWTEDVRLLASTEGRPGRGKSIPAKVRFRLPDDVAQGDPLWYGARLSYQWTGSPGKSETPEDYADRAELVATWNGYGFHLTPMTPLTDLDGGFQWAVVDLVNGGSHGYETTPTFVAASTNFAMYKAVRGGWNGVSIYLDHGDASNKDMEALIKKESEIIATSWRRAYIEGDAWAKVNDDGIHLRVEGENVGWGAPELTVRAMIFREDGSSQFESWHRGPLGPLAPGQFREALPHDNDSPVVGIGIKLDWGSGSRTFRAWPPEPGQPWYTRSLFRSTIGGMIALVVVWIGAPMLYQALRQSRRQRRSS